MTKYIQTSLTQSNPRKGTNPVYTRTNGDPVELTVVLYSPAGFSDMTVPASSEQEAVSMALDKYQRMAPYGPTPQVFGVYRSKVWASYRMKGGRNSDVPKYTTHVPGKPSLYTRDELEFMFGEDPNWASEWAKNIIENPSEFLMSKYIRANPFPMSRAVRKNPDPNSWWHWGASVGQPYESPRVPGLKGDLLNLSDQISRAARDPWNHYYMAPPDRRTPRHFFGLQAEQLLPRILSGLATGEIQPSDCYFILREQLLDAEQAQELREACGY